MRVRLTTLTENTAGRSGLLAEHGLSILVEVGERKVLLDTGASFTAVHNARALGVDLRQLDAIVLSHGHADHTGGLKEVLREATRGGREIEVIAHPQVWSPHYSRPKGERPRYAGIPFLREEMESMGARFRLEHGPTKLPGGMLVTGEVPRATPFERLPANLVVRASDGWHQDEMPDDQALLVRTDRGLVVVLGCAHSGVVNTLEHARRITGEDRVYAVVGGTHLGPAPREQLEQTVRALKELGVQRVGVSHCTGMGPSARLIQEYGDAFSFNNAGNVIELPADRHENG